MLKITIKVDTNDKDNNCKIEIINPPQSMIDKSNDMERKCTAMIINQIEKSIKELDEK